MDLLLWVVAWSLAALMLMVGMAKLTRSRGQLQEQMDWVNDFSMRSIRLIGIAELAAAVALVVPPLLGVAEFLTPLAAAGVVLLMVGAALVHVRRHENGMMLVNLVIAAMGTFIAVGRGTIEPF